jgi:hypothetical protein
MSTSPIAAGGEGRAAVVAAALRTPTTWHRRRVIHARSVRRGEVLANPPVRGKDPVARFVRRDGDVPHFACEEAILPTENLVLRSPARSLAHRVPAG